jgi:sodium-dependent dicarboxylate transporter 2/3/5
MWISNTATTIMMLPMVLAVCSKIEEWEDHSTTFNDHFSKAILLGVAFSASIGGMATLIGSPPNLILAGTIEKTFGESLSFMQWFQAGFPVSVVLLIIAGLYLGRGLNVSNGQVDKSILREQMMDLGPISSDEKRVLIVFLLTALAWMLRSYLITPFLPQLDDTIIALIAALTLFVLPSKENGRLIDWKDAEKLPWGILLLFGGGIALASGFDKTGTASLLAEQLGYLNGMGPEIPYVMTVGGINFLTEITSNLATTAVVLPVLAPFAEALGVHPYQLMVGATLAASCAFMLPVGTPPNAIVFSSGKISIQQMVRVGLAMNLISILVITLYTYLLLPLIWSL